MNSRNGYQSMKKNLSVAQTNTVIDCFSTALEDIEQLLRQEPSPFSQVQPLEWSLCTPLHTVEGILRMERDGSTSLWLTALPSSS